MPQETHGNLDAFELQFLPSKYEEKMAMRRNQVSKGAVGFVLCKRDGIQVNHTGRKFSGAQMDEKSKAVNFEECSNSFGEKGTRM